MAKYSLSNKAVDDLSAIWNYTFETWSESQADKYYLMLISTIQELAENPRHGKPYFEISENIMGFHSGRHIIFYQSINENEIFVLRILHDQMDLKVRIQE